MTGQREHGLSTILTRSTEWFMEHQFQSINLAGKCGLLLSAISADGEQTMPFPKVHALANAAGITTLEVQGIIDELKCIFPL